ncbi:helix-turn-helix domain-containing protein [Flavobacterium hercynium]|uniref:Transcriptional regulator n=1 Tax=Flavobacterium hercynium TaxID=387094 RepID=A0A226H4X5_9FLAO|nr:helix-turn-helix transcriptional regulator [Flavobacterium hercynium]OXA88701.1 transcriptional regulator [Flavobacterium hercynium]SMP34495.1 DNA-binding transcriptional regulator, XRE-family HTH domain [Flavobacterium hercynium]
MNTGTKRKHIGRNISRIRELRGMKQEALAEAMGVSQQTVSILEGSDEIEEQRLAQIARALGVNVEALENFTEESVFNYFNTFYDNSTAGNGMFSNHPTHCTFNPLDKVVELYERLVKSEKDRADALDKLLKAKQ